jgi:uncharacterized protein (TIGR00266 family)
MKVKLAHQPSYAMAYCILDRGESLLVERDGMSQMSSGIEVSAGFGPGGVGKAAMRRTLGGEGFLLARYSAQLQDAWVAVAPKFPGDIAVLDFARLGGRAVVVEQGAFLACAGPGQRFAGVEIDVRWSGMRGVLLREGATMLRLHGDGLALISSYGGIEAIELSPGEVRFVDSGHLVGFTEDVGLQVGPLGGVTQSVLTGEGLVARISAPPHAGALIWTQTRSEQALTNWLFPDRAQNRPSKRR